MSKSVVGMMLVKLSFPDEIEVVEGSIEVYDSRPQVKIKVRMEMENVVLRGFGDKVITIRRLMIEGIRGRMLPVVEDGNVVLFKTEDGADKPTVVSE